MRIRTAMLLLLTSFIIIVLLGLAAYLTIYIMDDTSENPASSAASIPNARNSDTLEASDPIVRETSTSVYGDEDYIEAPHHFIFVGDSRTVGMKNAVAEHDKEDPCTYIAKEGEGYKWFYNDGIPQMEEVLSKNPDCPVILNLGVNDLENIRKYLDLYQIVFDAHPNTTFYIMSVNPVNEAKFSGLKNQDIQDFNLAVQETFPDKYLDCYTYLTSGDWGTVDGLHYTKDTYRSIHHFSIMILSAASPA